jgi:hypothetical protein
MARLLLRREFTPTPVGDPYPWHTSFNRQDAPWHIGSGSWGAQVEIDAPAAPVTTRQVTVHTQANFNTEAAVDGTEITIGTGWSTGATVTGSDIDIIVPAGITISHIQLGAWPYEVPVDRLRVRGTTLGEHSGGRVGQFRDFELASDIIIDGVDINNASGFSTAETNACFRCYGTRYFIGNVRGISAGALWLGGAKHVFIANSNFYHGGATRAQVGVAEGWGFRNTGGPFTIVDSQIAGTRYHNVRMQSVGGSGELFFTTGTDYMALAEGPCAWLWNNLNQSPLANGQGAIVRACRIYGYSHAGCGLSHELTANNCNYSRVEHNTFYSGGAVNYTQGYLDARQAAGGTAGALAGEGGAGDHNWSVGNMFAALTAFPAWGGPGDPTSIPLPGGLTLIQGEGICPAMP